MGTIIGEKNFEPDYTASEIGAPWCRLPGLSKGLLNWDRVLVLYRYISWFLTSAFSFIGTPDSLLAFKVGVAFTLLLAGRVAIYLYEYNKEKHGRILGLVIIETVGIAFLLIPTGGLNSPFMWYALNPIFIAATLVPAITCWEVLAVFLAAATVGSTLFNGQPVSVFAVWQEQSWLLLVFLLLTSAVQLFARLVKQLSDAYDQLSIAHQETQRSLQHTAALYQALEAFSSREDPKHLSSLLASYTRKLIGSRAGVCYLVQDQSRFQGEISDPDKILDDAIRETKINEIWRHISRDNEYIYSLSLNSDIQLVCVSIKSSSTCFGFLGYTTENIKENYENCEPAINFLAELGASVLERCKAEELSGRLLVAEEQNRIANEIHDGVAQHLFSMVYALHALAQKSGDLQDVEVRQQLELLKRKANQAAKELRASIYRISPLKRGDQVFVAGLRSYLEGIEKLNGINVNFNTEGSEDTLSPALRKALYRIVCEATSNAARHGGCDKINIDLQMAPGKVLLQITDNGSGFNIHQAKGGLGLTNMRNLMMSFNGRLVIDSKSGKGTKVICAVPGDKYKEDEYEENLNIGGGIIENCGSG